MESSPLEKSLKSRRSAPSLLTRLLVRRAAEAGNHPAYLFLADGEVEAERLTWSGLEARARSIAAALAAQVPPGERVLLFHPPGLELVAAFFGCLFAGVVAVPATPPRPRKDQPRLRAIVRDAEPRLALTTAELLPGLERAAAGDSGLAGLRWLATDHLPAVAWEGPDPDPGSLAFLQYTSGSTAAPKGVMVTHASLVHNERLIGDAFAMDESAVVVGWLPLYHDMGLIGNVLQPLWCGGRCILMSPVAFLQRPRRWLEAVTRYRATTSGGPNFAYDLCVRKVGPEEREGLDLSSWRVAFNGAEPVRAETLERFAAAFAPYGFRREALYPCYGLAEATLFVAGGRVGEPPRVAELESRPVVGCGAPRGGQRVAIADPETGAEVPPGRTGEIWVAGPSVAAGYWRLPEATAATFGATLAGDPDRWLRTGDLGFLDVGELFVTGRLKDLIILRGRNHYPQDIELTAERSHPALRPGCGASFSVDVEGEERLVVVQELDRRAKDSKTGAVIEAIRQAVAGEHEVKVHDVVLVRVGGVPRTSSGKIQRRACRARYLAGELPVVAQSVLAPVAAEERADGFAPEAQELDVLALLRAEAARALSLPRAEIPADQPLTALGLDSLSAVELQQAVAARTGRQVALSALLQGLTLEQLAAACAEGAEAELDAGFDSAAAGLPGEPGPLSQGQRALWFLQTRDPGSAALHLAAAFRVAGLDTAAFRRALEALQARHAALRTVFGLEAGEPFQRILAAAPLDFREEPAADGEALRERLCTEAFHPFDLAAPLLRARVWSEAPGRQLVLLAVHHLVADFASVAILLGELDLLYRQECGAVERVELPPPFGAPADFARRQARYLAGPAGERAWSYWRERLAGELPVLALTTDRPRPAWLSDRGSVLSLRLAPETADRLRRLGRAEGATLFAVLLAAYQTLLHRHTGQDGLLVGTPAAGRTHPGLAGLVGYLVQPVALRGDLSGDLAVGALLRQTQETVASALEHQDFPLPLLAERLQPERDPGRSPLFQTLFVLHRDPPGGAGLAEIVLGAGGVGFELGGLTWESVALGEHRAQLELALAAADTAGGLSVVLQSSRDLFDEATVARLLGHFAVLLDGFGADAGRPVADLPLLTPAEEDQVRVWSTGPDLPEADGCLHELFAAQVARTPRAEALVAGEERLTYEQLSSRARQLALHLRTMGVGPEVTVGVCLERSADLVVSLLGVLEAGGAYVPLDPAYPGERLAWLLEDARADVLVTREGWLSRLPRRPDRVVLLDPPGALPQTPEGARALAPAALPSNLAYLIYTSGSTGRPKGVAIPHHNAVALVRWARQVFTDAELGGVLAATSVGFDLSVFELFVPLCCGGRVILADSALALASLAAASEVTLINTVPSAIAELAASGALPAGGVTVNLAGEALSEALVRRLHGLPAVRRLLNLYGPSETTTYSTFAELPAGQAGTPSIGAPITGTRVHLLDVALRPVPVGAPGEVWIGGAGVARGYQGRPELTAERFMPDPFSAAPGGRLYRTGDLARRRPAGALEYLGRSDHQVKIRGFRIEPGEIEAALAACPGVRDAVVMVRESAAGDRRLVAWVAGGDGARPEEEALRCALRERLPEALVPAAFVMLEEMPRTPHGKIDRKALPDPAAPAGGSAPPRGPLEELLAGLWSEVLGLAAVGRTDSFFHLGGHSLLAARLVSRLRDALGVELPLRTLFEAPTLAALAQRVEQALGRGAAAALPPVLPAARGGALPLSFAQERLWFLDQLEPGSAAYCIPGAVRLSGALEVPALARALGEIVRRHEVLRTRFPDSDTGGRPVQVVEPGGAIPLPVIDLRGLAETQREAEACRLARAEALRPFELARGPLLRAGLVRLDHETWICGLSLHHIVADGWSLALLEAELATLHAAFREGRPSPLPELAIQYADYAIWQRRHLQGDVLAGELAWWRRQLAGAPEELQLPTDRPRPAAVRRPDGRQPVELSAALRDGLERLGRQAGATLYMTLLAAFAALLSRQADQEDLVVGSPVAGRSRRELEGLIGLFVNSLALRVDLAGEPSFATLLGRVRETALSAFAHQDLPFEKLVEELAPERRLGRTPLFQVMFALQNVPQPAAAAGLTLVREPAPPGAAKLDLALDLWPGEGIAGWIDYRGDLFEGATVRRLVGHLESLLAAALVDPGQPVSALPLLADSERRQLLAWSRSPGAWAAPGTVQDLIAEQARRTPDREAVAGADAAMTYGELRRRAELLAGSLGELEGDRLVGLMADAGPRLAVGLLGILEAGGAFVPLHPAQPEERLGFVARDCALGVLVTESRHLARAQRVAEAAGGPCRVVCLDELPAEAAPRSAVAPPPESLAWVIYTSGSTGRPKGVAVSHAAAVAMLRWSRDFFGLGPHTRVLQSLSYAFDFGVWEMLTTLLSGGVLHTLAAEEQGDAAAWARRALAAEIDTVHATPSFFRAVQETGVRLEGLRILHLGGEALTRGALERLAGAVGEACTLYNGYGPTEVTVNSLIFAAGRPGALCGGELVPIGRPSADNAVWVMSRRGELQPMGVPGELWVGGPGVARGYLGRPDLTAEKFVPDPLGGEPGGRLYRTGDLVRWLPDGAVEFLGRVDDQVKIRGFRVEPGETEAVLRRHPDLRAAVVVAREVAGHGLALVAYVIPAGEAPSPGALREFLRATLPEAMLPSFFVPLADLPLTATGKVDRKALPEPRPDARPDWGTGGEPTAPRTAMEALLAEVWCEVLERERVGVHESFFDLGGHSLLATRVTARLRSLAGVEIPVAVLFQAPTVAALAREVEALRRPGLAPASPPPPITRVPREAPLALSYGQERLWFLEHFAPGGAAYNMTTAARLTGELDGSALEQGLDQIVRRHESLRTVFPSADGSPVQRIEPLRGAGLAQIDLRALPAAECDAEVRRLVRQAARRSFDVERGPLTRFALLELGVGERALVIELHHIVADGWSIGVLQRELTVLYEAARAGTPARFPELPVQPADHAAWQRSWLQGEALESRLAFWRRELEGAPTVLELPADRPRPPVFTFRGAQHAIRLPADTTTALRRLARSSGATLFMTLLAGFQTLLSRLADQPEVLVGTPVAGRNRTEIEGVIGFFVNTLVIRGDLRGEPSFRDLVGRVRERCLAADAHQEVPFERLVEELALERDLSRSPLVQALLALQNVPLRLELPGLAVSPLEVDPGTAKLDLSLVLWEQGEELAGWIEYSTDLFEEATIERLAGHLRTLLEGALAHPEARLSELPLLAGVEERHLPAGHRQVSRDQAAAAERRTGGALRTPTEEVVAGIWADLLGLESVGAFDSFFDLGGHSLLANRVAVRLQEAFGVAVPLARFFQHPTVAGLASEVEALRAAGGKTEDEPVRPVPRSGDFPLSFAQERLWILDRFEPGNANFNIPASLRLLGEVDAGALERAFQAIVTRHESLRTTFEAVGERAVQRIAPAGVASLPVVDLRGLSEAERARAVQRWSRDVTATSFDLARGPLLRLVLLRTSEREHVLLLAIHHIVSDGWSIGVLVRELSAVYAALAAGRAPELPELPVQYADYAVWQRERLRGERLEDLVRFWRQRLRGAPPALELPTDRPRPAIRTFRGGHRPLAIAAPLAGELRRLARRQGVSLFMLLLAAFEVVLARLSGQDDLVVGTPVAGRSRPELEGMMGIFLNTLVLRTGLAGALPFTGLLGRVRATALEAFDHQELPFEKLLDELRPERDLSRTPLFQVFFNMLNFPMERVELPGLAVEPLEAPENPAKFDLTVYAAEEGAEIRFELVYNADLFTDARMAELLRQYAALLEQVAEAPERPIGELSLVTGAARLVLPDPRAELDPSWQGAVHEIFAGWARREPGRLAVTDKDESWTYGELAERASRLAGRLADAGVGRGDVVALYGHRSARLVWAVLGVLAAGAAFTVLDPAHPPARQVECLRVAAPRGWIALAAAGPLPPDLAGQVAAIPCRLTLPLPAEDDSCAAAPAGAPAVSVGPDDLAYVAFTSGSTGVPKGILGRHGPLSHFIPWQRREFALCESDRYSLLSGLAHDPLQRDLFTPLQTGGAICVPDPADIAKPGHLAAWMRRERVTVAHLTPAMGQILTELPPGTAAVRLEELRWAFFVGDVLTRRDVARLRGLAPGVTCVNFYGSTETQRAVGYHVERAAEPGRQPGGPARDSLPLGRGMRGVQLLVLSRQGELAGIGEIGEIHVRSPHLARGYLGDPAGTAARFVADSGDRMYRTGDLGRYLPDGEVEFAGRVDFQLKIRGFRIEPGEIESLLARHPAVRKSVVAARDGARGEKRLIAWVVPQAERSAPPVSELRAWLKERLPEAMIPAAFVLLPRLPLNPNGKVDRRALPEPREEDRNPLGGGVFEGPRNETERTLAAVLLDVLQVDKIGIHDNFFELGGNSLLLVRAHARLRELLGGDELQVVDLFSHPTVASLADHLGQSRKEPAAVRQSDERADKIEAGQGRLRALRQRQQGAR